jgi:hypothetical protein
MKVKEIIKILAETPAKDYPKVRIQFSDSTIDLIRDMLPSQYFLFQQKEEMYQELFNLLIRNASKQSKK